MTAGTKRSAKEQPIHRDGGIHASAFEGFTGDLIDGCRDAVAMKASMPQRGRIDVEARSVVVTARLGGAMILQRIPLNAYNGVAAELVAQAGEDPTVQVVLRHNDPAYSIALDNDLPLHEAVAVWRSWADRLSAPLLLQEGTGQDSVVRAMLGPVVLRASQPRRHRPTAGRRPRFSKRLGLRR